MSYLRGPNHKTLEKILLEYNYYDELMPYALKCIFFYNTLIQISLSYRYKGLIIQWHTTFW